MKKFKKNKKMNDKLYKFKHNIYALAGSHNLLLNVLAKIKNKSKKLIEKKSFSGGAAITPGEQYELQKFNSTQEALLDTLGTTGIAGLKLAMQMANGAIKSTLGEALNKIDPELANLSWEQAAPYLTEKIKVLEALVTEAFEAYNNPARPNPNQFRDSVDNILKVLSEAAVEILEIIEPKLDAIVEKIRGMMIKTSVTLGTASVTSAINFAKAAISAIPVVGGILNLLLSFGKIFNAITKIFLIFVDTNSGTGIKLAEMVKGVSDKISATSVKAAAAIDELSQAANSLEAKVPKALPVANVVSTPPPVNASKLIKGGKAKTKKLEQRIKNKLDYCNKSKKHHKTLKHHLK